MKKYLAFFFLLLFFTNIKADEGMLVPLFLKNKTIDQMHILGFKLSADDIYNINNPSLKDAVMIFGGGCTGELISPEGLILTNYHCGYSSIQNHSTIENNIISKGFFAYDKSMELPNPALTVTFLIYMKDVTKRVLKELNDSMSIKQRKRAIDSISEIIEQQAEKKSGNKYNAKIKEFYYGNQYIMMVTETFRDIRLVGAPPSEIGKFGGDTDNWVWPRHTGDFSLFRIYANKNNEPADYSPDNVPYKPKKFFTINAQGVKEGDFTMILGYPGYTQEYIPSPLVKNLIDYEKPLRIKIRQTKLDIINKAMQNDQAIKIKYFSKQASIANGWKKWIGQIQGLKRLNILKEKKESENKFQTWTDTYNNGQYKNLLNQYSVNATAIRPYLIAFYSYVEDIYLTDMFKFYKIVTKWNGKIASEKNNKKRDSLKNKAIVSIRNFYNKFSPNIENQIYNQSVTFYKNDVDKKFLPIFYSSLSNANIDRYIDSLWQQSILTDTVKLKKYFSKLSSKHRNEEILENDPLIKLISSYINIFYSKVVPNYYYYQDKIDSLNRLYMKAQMQMQPEKNFYPDANFTIRVSYGTVRGSEPRDGMTYKYYTTLDGVIAKENPLIPDYQIPEKIKELYKNKDFGPWKDKKDGKIHTCFLANNHTTGGNSGSPVINANGELIGVNFDRCWEGTMSDIKFDTTFCRNISLDIRYMLFIVDKYAGAENLINEMNIKY